MEQLIIHSSIYKPEWVWENTHERMMSKRQVGLYAALTELFNQHNPSLLRKYKVGYDFNSLMIGSTSSDGRNYQGHCRIEPNDNITIKLNDGFFLIFEITKPENNG